MLLGSECWKSSKRNESVFLQQDRPVERDITVPYCEILNTQNWHDCTGDELEFKRGLDLYFWRLLKDVRYSRVWVSGGLIRWKLSEEVLPFSPPFFPLLPVPPSFLLKAYNLSVTCFLSFRVWPLAEQWHHCKEECIFAWKKSYRPSDMPGGKKDLCSCTQTSVVS